MTRMYNQYDIAGKDVSKVPMKMASIGKDEYELQSSKDRIIISKYNLYTYGECGSTDDEELHERTNEAKRLSQTALKIQIGNVNTVYNQHIWDESDELMDDVKEERKRSTLPRKNGIH